jgi:hypothetical protein
MADARVEHVAHTVVEGEGVADVTGSGITSEVQIVGVWLTASESSVVVIDESVGMLLIPASEASEENGIGEEEEAPARDAEEVLKLLTMSTVETREADGRLMTEMTVTGNVTTSVRQSGMILPATVVNWVQASGPAGMERRVEKVSWALAKIELMLMMSKIEKKLSKDILSGSRVMVGRVVIEMLIDCKVFMGGVDVDGRSAE